MKRALIVLAVVLTMMTGCSSSNRSSSSMDRMNQEQSASKPQNNPEAASVPQNISVSEAKQIALNYFDQNEQRVVFNEIKTVVDNGRTVIEIEMTFDHQRFEIEIDAKTGAVLEVDEEKDDSNK